MRNDYNQIHTAKILFTWQPTIPEGNSGTYIWGRGCPSLRQMTSAVRLLVTSLSSSLFTPECIAPEMHESIDVHLFRCINGMGTICILTGSTATPTLHDNQEFIAENYKSRRFPTRQCVYACVNIISEKERFAFRPWALFCSVFVSSLSSLFFACYFFAFLCFSIMWDNGRHSDCVFPSFGVSVWRIAT